MRGFLTDVTADEVLDGVGYLGAFDSGSKLQRQHFRMVTQPPDQRQSNNISKLFSRFFKQDYLKWASFPPPPPLPLLLPLEALVNLMILFRMF